jgi:hypothetical protein
MASGFLDVVVEDIHVAAQRPCQPKFPGSVRFQGEEDFFLGRSIYLMFFPLAVDLIDNWEY